MVEITQVKRKGGKKYYPSKEGNLYRYAFYLTRGEKLCAQRCAYLIKSCRSKNGKANVTYFYRFAVRRVMREIISKLGGQQAFLARTHSEQQLVIQKKKLIEEHRRNRPKRIKRWQYI